MRFARTFFRLFAAWPHPHSGNTKFGRLSERQRQALLIRYADPNPDT